MAYGEIPIEYYTERGREIPGYSFTPEADWDEGDWESAVLASELDAHSRLRALEEENARLRAALYGDSD